MRSANVLRMHRYFKNDFVQIFYDAICNLFIYKTSLDTSMEAMITQYFFII